MTDTPKMILVIEDQAETAEMFGEMLRVSGYEIKYSNNSQQAMQMVQDAPPDAIVLDVMMPEVSGLEVLRYIRGQLGLSDLPVIVVSAKALPSDVQDGIKAGATAYLTKPLSFLDLKQAVESALRDS